MPTMVKVPTREDERSQVVAEKLGELDALDLARNIHAATGEVVQLIPYVLKKGEYVLDEANAKLFGEPEKQAPGETADLSKLTVKELNALAAEHDVTFDAKAKKTDKVAALEAALKE